MRYAAAIVFSLLGSALLLSSLETARPRRLENDGLSRTVDNGSRGAAPMSVLVMAFIDTSDPDASGENRSQALVLRSIHDQYEQRGIRVIIVQSSKGRRTAQDSGEQLNARYDWGLAEMTIVPDLEGRLAEAYEVREFPTTMVIGNLGNLIAVWEGYSPPSVWGPALDRISLQSGSRYRGHFTGEELS